MVFIGFVKRLNSELFSQIVSKDALFFLNGKEACYCELCGVVIDSSSASITLCDFFGTIQITKSPEMIIDGKGPYIFTIKLYLKKNKVNGHCKSIKAISIYEELVFNIEVQSLISTCCY